MVDLATVPLEICPDSHGDLSTLVYKAWKMHGFELMKDGEPAKSKPLPNTSNKKRGRQATEEDAKPEGMSTEEASLVLKQFETGEATFDNTNYENLTMACSVLDPKGLIPDKELLKRVFRYCRK